MKKIKFIIGNLLLVLVLLFNGSSVSALEKDNDKKIILIDPGHGGLDGGAVSKGGTIEKGINLEISKKLRSELEKNGFKVHLTREDDSSLEGIEGTIRRKKVDDLNNRCKMKKDLNCDAFISIHLNMFTSPKAKGAQVWYSDFEASKGFAAEIQNSLKDNLDKDNSRISKPANNQYKILRDKYPAPCVIVECGFLSNSEEEQLLKNEEYQQKLAEAIAKGVINYYSISKN